METSSLIVKEIKKKKLRNGTVKLVQLTGNNLYAVLTYNPSDEQVNAVCECYFDQKVKCQVMKQLNRIYKEEVNKLYGE